MVIVMIFSGLAYLLGSISSAILVCRLFGLPDPRNDGSRNPGATNVLRLGGKLPALLTLLGDLLKGLFAVWFAKFCGLNESSLGLVGLAVFLGHVFPCFFNFQGGKGVATFIGVILGLNFLTGLLVIFTWIGVVLFYRYSSLASLVASCLSLILSLFVIPKAWLSILLMFLMLVWRHRNNISRLKFGTENKLHF